MNKRLIQVECPYCRHSYSLMRDTYVLAGRQEQQRLQERIYFMRQCQCCMSLFEISYPMIYKDAQKKFCLILAQSAPENFSFDGKCVLCRTPSQFYDAFFALNAQLDLQRVLEKKAQMIKKKGPECKLYAFDPKTHILWFKYQENLVGIGY